MVNVGAQSTVVTGVRGTVTMNGNLYTAFKTFNCEWGNKQEKNPVGGTDIQIITTAEFDGEGELVILYSTERTLDGSGNPTLDEQFSDLLTPANGQVGPINLVVTGADVQKNMRTFTWTGSIWPKKTKYQQIGASTVQATINFDLNSRPVLT